MSPDPAAAVAPLPAKAHEPGPRAEFSRRIVRELRRPLAGLTDAVRTLHEALHGNGDGGLGAVLHDVRWIEAAVRGLHELARTRRPSLRAASLHDELFCLLRRVASPAAAAGAEVRIVPAGEPPSARIDRELTQQAFEHLVLNAIQAMPQGGTLTLRPRRPEAGSAYAAVEFADTGCGIPPEDVPHIFEPFFTRRVGRVGLGLALVTRLVESQGGRICVQSTPAVGTSFTIYLPRADGEDDAHLSTAHR
jgi:signal transduction histidine kinase